MSAAWVTAAIEGASREVTIRFGAGHALMASQPDDERKGARAPGPFDLFVGQSGGLHRHYAQAVRAARNWSWSSSRVDLEIVGLAQFDERREIALLRR